MATHRVVLLTSSRCYHNTWSRFYSDDDSFQSFSTSTYKLHYLHTATSYHFVLLTSPMAESLRFLLRQIHTGPFTDWVIRNPLVDLDSNNGKGIDNEQFRKSVEKLVLSINV